MILVYNHPLIFIAFEEGVQILHPQLNFIFPLKRGFKTLWPQYIEPPLIFIATGDGVENFMAVINEPLSYMHCIRE